MQNYKLGATQAQYKLQACRRTGVIQNNKLQSLQPHRQQNYKLAATQARFKNDKFTATQAKQATDLPPNRLATLQMKWKKLHAYCPTGVKGKNYQKRKHLMTVSEAEP